MKLPLVTKTSLEYAKSIRDAIRGLWSGTTDFASFVFAMNSAIERNLTIAWQEGARQAGIQPDELTQSERAELRRVINNEFTHVFAMGDRVLENLKAEGGLLRDATRYVPLWANRYEKLKVRAMVMAGTNKKFRWNRDARDSCKSCLKLAGKVKRLSFWKKHNIWPRHPKLECMAGAAGVDVCRCSFEETDAKATPGPLPSIP